MNWKLVGAKRRFSAILILVGLPGFIFCGVTHICMDGHMGHPPYAAWQFAVDVIWVGCFWCAGIVGWKSDLPLRSFLCYALPFITIQRIVVGSLGGLTLLLELPLGLFVTIVAIRAMRHPGFDPLKHTVEEAIAHKEAVRRRWKTVWLGLLAIILVFCVGLFVWREIRVSRVPSLTIAESALPFSYELPMARDACVWMTLPSGKRVALWREDFGVWPEWGERPYREPARIWQQDSGTSKSSDRVKSYMQMGLDAELSSAIGKNQYSLFVGNYCIAWPLVGQTNVDRRVLLTVRLAKESELEALKKQYGKWPLFD